MFLSRSLLSLVALASVAHAWSLTATLVSGKTYTIRSSTGAVRPCDGLSIISSPVDFFDWSGFPNGTKIELYPGINCTGAKWVGFEGLNDVNPNKVYVSYRVFV